MPTRCTNKVVIREKCDALERESYWILIGKEEWIEHHHNHKSRLDDVNSNNHKSSKKAMHL